MPDLTTISGLSALQSITQGDPRIKIAVIDGRADFDRTCFRGARVSRVKPFWQDAVEPIDPFYIQQQIKIDALKDRKKKLQKQKKIVLDPGIMPSIEHLQPTTSAHPAVLSTNAGQLVGSSQTIFSAPLKNNDPAPLERFRQLTAQPSVLASIADRLVGVFHATSIFSLMVGQPGSPLEGIAPYCTAINIPLFEAKNFEEALSPLHLAHAFNLALKLDVNIIHCAACHPTITGFAHEMIQRAVKQCQDNNILIIAPVGNNKGEHFCVPAILPNTLAVGAMKDDGQPAAYSNFGGEYQKQGILAPGENILVAQPDTDEPIRKEGTSLAAPVITGIAALFMSLQLQRGEKPNAEAVRTALLHSVILCDPQTVPEPDRCLAGKLHIPGAYQKLTGQPLPHVQPVVTSSPQNQPTTLASPASPFITPAARSPEVASPITASSPAAISLVPNTSHTLEISAISQIVPAEVLPSAVVRQVYALGQLGYDFGTEARRDIFKQQMPAVDIDGTLVPANPYDPQQMVDYLAQSPAASKELIWTFNQELTPLYVVQAKGAFATEIYAALRLMLAGQIQMATNEDYIERISICGKLTDRTVELFSGEVLPVVILPNVRGMYGWQVNNLVEGAIATIRGELSEVNVISIRRSLRNFLQRVYYDLKNPGQLDRDRALNFAATNTFQVASVYAAAVAHRMELDHIEVEKSSFCRLHSNCWDVKLRFFDPENTRRGKKIFRFTIDVKDTLPVTLGEVRSWSVPRDE
jgi:cyanobactin maturation PatA/PatG family protease